MKKILTLVIVLAMILTLSVNVFAAEISNNQSGSNSASADVKVTVSGTSTPDAVYFVVVDWSSLDFTYSLTANSGWNTDSSKDHGYANAGTGGWSNTEGTVTVTNHSNVGITVAAVAEAAANTYGVTVDCALAEKVPAQDNSLNAAVAGTEWSAADSAEYTITVSGTPTSEGLASTTVATVKVSIS